MSSYVWPCNHALPRLLFEYSTAYAHREQACLVVTHHLYVNVQSQLCIVTNSRLGYKFDVAAVSCTIIFHPGRGQPGGQRAGMKREEAPAGVFVWGIMMQTPHTGLGTILPVGRGGKVLSKQLNVRASPFDCDLSSFLPKRPAVAFQCYHGTCTHLMLKSSSHARLFSR